jgi:hypothetical protein
MNKTTAQRYQDMHQVAETISTRLKTLSDKCKYFCCLLITFISLLDQDLRPQLEQIEQIDEVSKRLEATVGALEKYFNSLGKSLVLTLSTFLFLEAKFKQIRTSPTRSQN